MPGRRTGEEGIQTQREPSLARLALGYVISAVAMTGLEDLYEAAQEYLSLHHGDPRWAATMFWHSLHLGAWTGGFLLVLSFPFAWVPLWLTLLACKKLSVPRLVSCLFAGVIVMLAFKLVRPFFLPSLSSTWSEVAAEWLRMSMVGGVSGLTFWAISYRGMSRRDPRIEEALAKLS